MYAPPSPQQQWLSVNPGNLYVGEIRSMGSASGVSIVWPATNLAIYVPLPVWTPCTVYALWWNNGTNVSSPTIDVALYNEAGTIQLAVLGGVTQGATGTLQTFLLTTPLALTPGTYWIGLVVGNNTTGIVGWSGNNPAGMPLYKYVGCQQQALGATAMPATTTFAAATNNHVPHMGIWCSSLTM